MEKGRYNKISDVAGVLVGHRTVEEGDVHTGQESSPAAASVMKNRFKILSFVKLAKNRFPAIPVSPGSL